MKITAKDIRLVRTCAASPEQYDAYDAKGGKIGFLRLRWGAFTAKCPGPGGVVVYSARTESDGMFEAQDREKYLEAAKEAIAGFYNESDKGGAE